MTAAAPSSTLKGAVTLPAERAPTASRLSAALEFLLIGGGTLLLLPLCFFYRERAGLDEAEALVGFLLFHAAVAVNNPHFAVTYLLFYENAKERAFGASYGRAQRARYVFAGLVVPLVLATWAGVALARHSATDIGLMIQLMFLLVGFHYVKQGFGVLTILSLRRGVRYGARERAIVLAHCFAAWLYGRTNPRDPGRLSVVDDVLYTSLPHPAGLDRVTAVLFAASATALLVTLVQKCGARVASRRLRRSPACCSRSGSGRRFHGSIRCSLT